MISVNRSELLDAFECLSAGGDVLVGLDTGMLHYIDDEFDSDEELPNGDETSGRSVALPHKNDLDLGRALALEFVARNLPDAHLQHTNVVTEVFRNRSALILWGFFFWFVLGCTAITCVTLRDGPPDGMSGVAIAGVCAFFCLVTVGLAFAAARKPVVVATVGPDRGLTVVLRYGLKRERRVFAASDVHGAKLVIGEDSEGSPYFRVRVAAGSGFHVDICEGHSRDECEKTCERFNVAYRLLPAAVDDRSIRV